MIEKIKTIKAPIITLKMENLIKIKEENFKNKIIIISRNFKKSMKIKTKYIKRRKLELFLMNKKERMHSLISLNLID